MRKLLSYLVVCMTLVFAGCSLDSNTVDPFQDLNSEVKAIDDYLLTHNIDAYKDKSGVRFQIVSLGTEGLPPSLAQSVKVTYVGKLFDGTTFESATTTGTMISFIQGWQYALTLFPKGTVAKLYIPASLAYGPNAVGNIPKSSNLMFDVTLDSVILSPSQKQRLAADIVAIDKFLDDNTITAVEDTTGIRYTINTPGTGPAPTWFTKVRFAYKGRLLVGGTTFFDGTAAPNDNFDSRVVDYINGMKVALQKMPVGTKATFYIPSGLAFGATGSSTIPADSNVIYDIEMLEIFP